MQEIINFCCRCGERIGEHDRSPCRKCRCDPFPQNTVLRSAGWRIKSRPKNGPDLWEKDGNVFTKAVAVKLLGRSRNRGKVLQLDSEGRY